MANKSVTVYDPIASDIQAITILYSSGSASSVEISGSIRTDDSKASHLGGGSALPTEFTSGVQTALGTMLTEAVALLAGDLGF